MLWCVCVLVCLFVMCFARVVCVCVCVVRCAAAPCALRVLCVLCELLVLGAVLRVCWLCRRSVCIVCAGCGARCMMCVLIVLLCVV